MKRLLYPGFLAVSCLLLNNGAQLRAQYNPYAPGAYGPYNRPPTTSPWLNLANTGNAGLNYFNLVRPEFEARARAGQFGAALYGLEQQQRNANAATGEIEAMLLSLRLAEPLPPTGHVATFGDVRPYFSSGPPRLPAQGGGPRPLGGGGLPGAYPR
jgi:hypothetical protein